MAEIGTGTVLKKVTTAVAEVLNIERSGKEREMIDCTDLDDTTRQWASAGIVESGTISITILYDPADVTHVALLTDIDAGTSAVYNIEYTNTGADVATATMFPVSFDLSGMEVGGRYEATVGFKITGAWTEAS